jgi:hypothetical protein
MDRQYPHMPALPADERTARTIHCTTCNAPPGIACVHITWPDQRTPKCVPRVHHTKRLKDALLVDRRRAEKAAALWS